MSDLRTTLSDWATRTEPWTGPASMTAEDGYNAAIEEVVNILNLTRAALASEGEGLDVETMTRAMERAMSAVDDEWTIPEFAELTAVEYARLREARP